MTGTQPEISPGPPMDGTVPLNDSELDAYCNAMEFLGGRSLVVGGCMKNLSSSWKVKES